MNKLFFALIFSLPLVAQTYHLGTDVFSGVVALPPTNINPAGTSCTNPANIPTFPWATQPVLVQLSTANSTWYYCSPSTNMWTSAGGAGGSIIINGVTCNVNGSCTITASGSGILYVADNSGSTSAYTSAGTGCAAPTDRQVFEFGPQNANVAGSVTFNYCGLGAHPVKLNDTTSNLPASRMPASPATVFLIYHTTGPYWELAGLPRLASISETGTVGMPDNDFAAATPAGVHAAISNLSPCSQMGTLGTTCNNTTAASAVFGEPPINPGGGRTWRTWQADGGTSGGTTSGMKVTVTGTQTAIVPTSTSNPMQMKLTAGGGGVAGIVSANALFYAGSQPKHDVGAQFSTTSSVSWCICMVGSTGTSGEQTNSRTLSTYTSGNYYSAIVGFRYNTAAGDGTTGHIMAIAAPNSSTAPTVVDTGVSADTNPHTYRIFVDDANSTIHFYIDGTENSQTAITSWAGSLPTGTALALYDQVYVSGGGEFVSMVYDVASANQ